MTAPESTPWSEAGATHEFADFVSTTTFDDLPDDVVTAVKWVILDTLAVAVAGADSPTATILADVVRSHGRNGISTVIGQSFKTDPASAALLNATTVHALDYDDYCFAMSGHPSAILLPPILGLAEARNLTGSDIIAAYAVGFEAAIMLSHTVNPDHYGHGWHGTGTVGAVGAAAAAANLLRLPLEQAKNALSIGVSSAAGLRQNFGTDVKPYHAGNAARAGVMAAELASRGYVGNHQILEGRWGFFHTFTAGERRDRGKPAFGFREPWSTLQPGITTKVFPSCGSTHAALGGILELRDRGLMAEDVVRVDVALTDISAGNLQYPDPRTGTEARFSLQYCLARALTAGVLGLDDFTDVAAREPGMRNLMARIHMHDDAELNAEYRWGSPRPAVLTVQTTKETIRHRAELPPGSPGNFSQQRLYDKVVDCVERGAIAGSAKEVIASVESLECCDDVAGLLAPLVGTKSGSPGDATARMTSGGAHRHGR